MVIRDANMGSVLIVWQSLQLAFQHLDCDVVRSAQTWGPRPIWDDRLHRPQHLGVLLIVLECRDLRRLVRQGNCFGDHLMKVFFLEVHHSTASHSTQARNATSGGR